MAARQKPRRKIEKDALGEHWTERRGAGFALVRRFKLSPGPVLITFDGQVKLSGFGLAPAAREKFARAKKTERAFAYLAPEQVRDGRRSQASDVFAVGCLLGEMLLGEALYIEPTFAETN